MKCEIKTCPDEATHRVTLSRPDAPHWKVYACCKDHITLLVRSAPNDATAATELINPAPAPPPEPVTPEPSMSAPRLTIRPDHCIVPGCAKDYHSHGLCAMHNSRAHKAKYPRKTDPQGTARMLAEDEAAGRVRTKVCRPKPPALAVVPAPMAPASGSITADAPPPRASRVVALALLEALASRVTGEAADLLAALRREVGL